MRFVITLALLVTMSLSSFTRGLAHQKAYSRHYPRVDQIDSRIHEQSKQIAFAQANGKISRIQALRYKKELYQIIQHEEKMRKQNRSHLTPKDQALLNHQLDEMNQSLLAQVAGEPVTYAQSQSDY